MKKRKHKRSKFLIFFIILVIGITLFEIGTIISNKTVSYKGKGVETVSKKDGYTTTFTTSKHKVYKEYKQGQNASWAHMPYWENQMWDNGCGITCIAIIATGYGKNITPEDLRQQYYPRLPGDEIPQAIRNLGIECTDFQYLEKYLSKQYILDWLRTDKPVLICVTNKPLPRWTKSSHYMLLLATTEYDKVYVSNPNEADGNNKSSGWYSINEIIPYLAKAVFITE